MDIAKGIQRSLDVYLKNFVPLFLATLVAGVLSGVTLGILAGPMIGGLIILVLKLLRGEKGEFNEIFAHFDKFVPTLLVAIGAFAAWLALRLLVYLIIPIWVLGPLFALLFNLALYPVIGLVFFLAIGFIVDKGAAPVDAVKKAAGCFLTNPLLVWLYVLVIGILAGLGAFVGGLINAAAFAALGFLGLFAMILTVPLLIALASLTAPFGILGLSVAYSDLSAKEPGTLKLDKQVLQIGGIVLACLVVVGLGARIIFHRGSYGAWGAGRLFGPRVGLGGIANPSHVRIGGMDISTDLPKDFPRDIPLYPGAKVEGGVGGQGVDGAGSVASFSTGDQATKVYAFYRDQLAAKGWTFEQSLIGESFKKDDRMVMILATEDGGKTQIVLTVSQEK